MQKQKILPNIDQIFPRRSIFFPSENRDLMLLEIGEDKGS